MSLNVSKRQNAVNRRSPAGDAFSEFAMLVLRLHGHLISAGDAISEPVGQTSARWQVLAAVEDSPKTVAQIARILALKRQSVQRVADLLTADGLAEFKENPDHLRAKLFTLTSRGRATLHAIQSGQRAWADELGAEIGKSKLQQANAVLERVLRRMRKAPEMPSRSPLK